MLYSRKKLLEKWKDQSVICRYFNKYKILENEYSKEFKRLKWHELDYLFSQMKLFSLSDEAYIPKFDLLEIPEAKHYVLYRIILTYNDGSQINFEQDVSDCSGDISCERKERHRSFFDRCLNEWFQEFKQRRGDYYSKLYIMYEKKIKELDDLKNIDGQTYMRRCTYTKACFFHIYYTVRLYFDEYKNEKMDERNVRGYRVFADIYTYSHVLCRHYYPDMNRGLGPTMNGKIDGLDIRNLPQSLLDLVEKSSKYINLDEKTQYILYEINRNPYILWIEYGSFGRHNDQNGFEIRTFYKCSKQRDLEKYNGTIEVKITDDIFLCVNKS